MDENSKKTRKSLVLPVAFIAAFVIAVGIGHLMTATPQPHTTPLGTCFMNATMQFCNVPVNTIRNDTPIFTSGNYVYSFNVTKNSTAFSLSVYVVGCAQGYFARSYKINATGYYPYCELMNDTASKNSTG